jgi:hypothetical protein
MISLSHVTRSELEVNSGPITESAPGRLSVTEAIIRATVPVAIANVASIQFRYLGQVDHPQPDQSGHVLNQIGLMLRAANPCNLIYLMWGLPPREKLLLQVKLNPGSSQSSECHGNNYYNVAECSFRGFVVGEMHELTAEVTEADDGSANVRAWIDWQEVLQATILPKYLTGIVGVPGLRSDNGKFDFRFSVGHS